MENKSSTKIIISSDRNSDKRLSTRNEEKNSYSKIPSKFKSIKKRQFQANTIYQNLHNKNILKFKSFILNLKSEFINLINRRISIIKNNP